ncbi:MAG: sigma-54-dependent Fis family transcriptional regulator [Proteobacteria bacterium]|nr:sigma-54-dependent Fis family transcriptional regulator [Pseudomonadota bacterium]MCP4922306.1 sigma-54-dependent Fis family transcriptional regulator [Pseudomonadota bacterium]
MALLLVDDDPTGRAVSAHNLRTRGHEVDEAEDGVAGLAAFDAVRHEVVITDLRMPGLDGIELLKRVRERAPGVPVVVVTAYGSVDKAVAAMREGAWSFIEKPFSRDRLELSVQRALEASRLRRDNVRLRSVERPIIAASTQMRELLELVDRMARSDAPALIFGESGTGKELVARRLHARGPRADKPFVAVNCAAIPAALLEAELFGHEKGAFTGAQKARAGRFRSAEGGTLFLDEIAEIPGELQAKLLRVLQERTVDVVGSDESVDVDVRIVAATNKDLDQRVSDGAFREDLYYRLNVLRVDIPALRDRPADVVPLAEAFLGELASRELTLDASARRALQARAWRGNVRELRNVCERLSILAPGPGVTGDEIPTERRPVSEGGWLDQMPPDLTLQELETQVIQHTLARCDGNVSQAARRLGVARHILAYRMAKFGIERG